MIIIDKMLERCEEEGRPIRVGMIGAGFMAKGILLQTFSAVKGIRIVAVSNRRLEQARLAFMEVGIDRVREVHTVAEMEECVSSNQYAVTEDPEFLCRAEGIDAIIEVTGTIEFGARIVCEALAHRKHVILMNAELDGTLGPILKVYADRAGVVITNVDGDQPGVIMNLYRFVKGIGVRPVLCGNIKGLHDPYRNPTTQEGFARRWKQNPYMVTSFADGTKISFEQAIVANATGMRVFKRGMMGPHVPEGTLVQEAVNWYPKDAMMEGAGFVDYVIGASPNPGVFVIGVHTDPVQQHYLNLYKMGTGPFYCFYTPYHLCHFEVPNTVARAVLFRDAAITPLGRPMVDVVAAAKRDLKAGEVLDGIGGYMTYGLCENAEVANLLELLPMGLAEGCRLSRDVPRTQVLTYADVALPEGRLSDRLRNEQNAHFGMISARLSCQPPVS